MRFLPLVLFLGDSSASGCFMRSLSGSSCFTASLSCRISAATSSARAFPGWVAKSNHRNSREGLFFVSQIHCHCPSPFPLRLEPCCRSRHANLMRATELQLVRQLWQFTYSLSIYWSQFRCDVTEKAHSRRRAGCKRAYPPPARSSPDTLQEPQRIGRDASDGRVCYSRRTAPRHRRQIGAPHSRPSRAHTDPEVPV
jgi:hypothetical protein